MEIYHLNCGTMRPFGLPSDDDTGGFLKRGHGVVHCLLIDTGEGLAMVDTGWGWRDCICPSPAVKQFMSIIGSPGNQDETAVQQIKTLGYNPRDVKHIFMTHMHLDHAGGLPDLPTAAIHIFTPELSACQHPRTLMEWRAYRSEHWAHNPKWQPHQLQGNQWFGLDCTPTIQVGDVKFVMIPFTGHTRGHCGIAVQVGERWLLHCGDSYGYFRQVNPVQPYQHPCGKLMEKIITIGFKIPRHHWISLRNLLREHTDKIQVFCSHDAQEFELCQIAVP